MIASNLGLDQRPPPQCSYDKHGGICIWIRWRFKLSPERTQSRCTFDTQQTIVLFFAALADYFSAPSCSDPTSSPAGTPV